MLSEVIDFAVDYLPLQDCKLLYAISSKEIFLNAIKRILKNPMKYKSHFEYDRNFEHTFKFVEENKALFTTKTYFNLVRLEVKIMSELKFNRWEHMSPLLAIVYRVENNPALYLSILWRAMIGSKSKLNLTKCQILLDRCYGQDSIFETLKYAPFISAGFNNIEESHIPIQESDQTKIKVFDDDDEEYSEQFDMLINHIRYEKTIEYNPSGGGNWDKNWDRQSKRKSTIIDKYCIDFLDLYKWNSKCDTIELHKSNNGTEVRSRYGPAYSTYSRYLQHTLHEKETININISRFTLISCSDDTGELLSDEDIVQYTVMNGNILLLEFILIRITNIYSVLGWHDKCPDYIYNTPYGLHIHHNRIEVVSILTTNGYALDVDKKDPKYLGITPEYGAFIIDTIAASTDDYMDMSPYYELCPACGSDIKLMEEILSKMKEKMPEFLPKLSTRNTAKNLVEYGDILRMDIMLYAVSKLDKSNSKEFVDEFMRGIEIGQFKDEYLEVIYDHDELSKYMAK